MDGLVAVILGAVVTETRGSLAVFTATLRLLLVAMATLALHLYKVIYHYVTTINNIIITLFMTIHELY